MLRSLRAAVLAALASTSVMAPAYASEQIGTIDNIQIAADGRILVSMTTTRTGKPACAAYDYWLVGDENSNAGKAQLALLLAAHNSGHQVQVFGTDTCVRWVDGENISSVREY